MQQHEARPTEYKGITFKSKSEAIVARGFDLLNFKDGSVWMYEPKILLGGKDKYTPDFLLVISYEHSLFLYVIEYKPVIPNITYLNELRGRFEYIYNNQVLPNVRCLLMCGSPFDSSKERCCGGIILGKDRCNSVDELFIKNKTYDYLFSKWEEAKKYRFDL